MKATVKAELDRLKRNAPGGLTTSIIITAARDRKNPLHNEFTWDAQQALQKNLEYEARSLIQQYFVVIVTETGPIKTRHFVSLSPDRMNGGGYRTIAEILDDEDLTAQLLTDALSELEAFAARYRRLEQLAGVFRAVEEVRRRHPPKARVPRGKKVREAA